MKFDVHKFSGSPAAHQLEKWSPSSQKSDLVFGGGGIQGRPHAVFVLFSGRRRWTGRRNRHEVSARCCKNWFFPLCAPCCFLACPQPLPCQRWKVVRYTACAGGGSSWSGCSGLTRSFWQLTAHATLFRHTTESWTIPNWARKVCELNDGFLFNMAVSTDGNNLITIYKPLNFCTVSDNRCLPLWTTLADVSLNLATILWFSALCWFHWMKWTLFDSILNFLLAHWKRQ